MIFALKRPTRRFKPYKDGLVFVFGLFFCLIGLFVANNALADSITDNFESYPLGNLSDQGNWYAPAKAYVINSRPHTGTKSIYLADLTLNYFATSTENGYMSFWFFYSTTTDYLDIDMRSSGNSQQFDLRVQDDAFSYYSWGLGGWTTSTMMSGLGWHNLNISWASNGGVFQYNFNLDNAGWSDRYNAGTQINPEIGIARFYSTTNIVLDDFVGYTITSDYIYIQPVFPLDCQFNLYENATGTAHGLINNPSGSGKTFNKLKIGFKDYLTGYYYSIASSTLNIPAGALSPYYADFSIGTSTYYLDYSLWDTAGNYLTFDRCLTSIGYATPTSAIDIINQPDYPAQEDCDSLGTTDRLLCELKNFFKGLFFPSGAKVIELQNNINQVKQRFPFSYVAIWTDFAYNLNNGTSTAITLSFFNASSSVNFTDIDISLDYGTESKGFLDRLRDIFQFVLIISFVVWGINYIKRIFK